MPVTLGALSGLNDALSLEYKREYGYARGHFRFSDVFDETVVEGPFGIFGLLLEEEFADSTIIQVSAVHDDMFNPVLISAERLKSLSQ